LSVAAALLWGNRPVPDQQTISKATVIKVERAETPGANGKRPVNNTSAARVLLSADTTKLPQPAEMSLAERIAGAEGIFEEIGFDVQPVEMKVPAEEKPAVTALPEAVERSISESPLEQDLLFILDTAHSYNSVVRYGMDDPDCYVQLYYGYAVISYKLRGRFNYASGKIHRQEIQQIEGVDYVVFAFQQDNSVAGLGFGNRVFFGYREIEKGIFEVVLFSQPWAAGTSFRSHAATPAERRALVERSNSQQR
jgi:hypothetical protein